MSFLICGLLQFKGGQTLARQREIAFRAAEAGLAERLFVQFGVNAGEQRDVFDILNIPEGRLRDDQLPFAITDSPADSTADSLICPLENSEDALRVNMGRLRRFFASLWRLPEIEHIEVYLSEGYDDVYDEYETSIEQFDQVATEKILATFGPDAVHRPPPKLILHRGSP